MLEKHHIIFKSQGGLDFPLNFKYLSAIDHRGNESPHMNRSVDLEYKQQLERDLRNALIDACYTIEEAIQILELKPKQAYKAFKRVRDIGEGMDREDIIFRLLGNRFYLGVD